MKTLLRDGAMATELERAGIALHPTLWSAAALLTSTDAIASVHRSYIDAGCDVLTTASYQCSNEGFKRAGFSHTEFLTALQNSVRIAKQSVHEAAHSIDNAIGSKRSDNTRAVQVFGGLGSVGASLADGSEFTAAYSRTTDEYEAFHRERILVMKAEGVDGIILETMPRLDEVLVATGIAMSVDLPIVIMFSVSPSGNLPDGSSFAQAAQALSVFDNVSAIGLNCCSPTLIEPALRSLRGATTLPLAAVPNRCDHWLADERRWEHGYENTDWKQYIPSWLELGMGLVGGCCHTRPDDIRAMRGLVDAHLRV